MITYLSGDATSPQASGPKIISHICNDHGKWGAGFVLALSKRWAGPEREYRDWYNRKPNLQTGEPFVLGSVQYVRVLPDILIANMIAQAGTRTGSKGPPIRYDALRKCLVDMSHKALETNSSVHMPRIGCGLAGGRWDVVGPIIESVFEGNVPVFVYDYP